MRIEPAISPSGVGSRLRCLIRTCDSFELASAWVTQSGTFDAVLDASHKLTRFVIGTHAYFTSPECLARCLEHSGRVKVMLPDRSPMFHPKVYLFRHAQRATVYVGSANLTAAGTSRNIECGVFITGRMRDPELQELAGFIFGCWERADELNEDFALTYAANWRRARRAHKELKNFIRLREPDARVRKKFGPTFPSSDMRWEEFLRRVRADPTHDVRMRLDVLARARALFSGNQSFAELTDEERRCIAGVARQSLPACGLNWGYFGQMSAHGAYTRAVIGSSNVISRALSRIPLSGHVEREHYEQYCREFYKIDGARLTWVGLGTRLLAMKRPDVFVCLDGANREGLCGYFGVAPTTTKLDNYWDRIVAPMSLMAWWQAESPKAHMEQEIWRARAAMLDSIFYDPGYRSKHW